MYCLLPSISIIAMDPQNFGFFPNAQNFAVINSQFTEVTGFSIMYVKCVDNSDS